ncbi:MAG TPA: DMT family transporter [Thermoanaerobaculia bacterium]|nr:DMT family transporter [Thermoanaerobaculia bacterium]
MGTLCYSARPVAARTREHRLDARGPSGPLASPAAPGLAVHATLLGVQLAFSGLHVWGKDVLLDLQPMALACLRVGFAAPVLAAVAWHHDRVVPSRRELPWLALLGLLGVFANQVLFITGLSYTTATDAGILMLSIPVFAAGLGAVFGIERIGPRRLGGIALAVGGALFLLDPGSFSTTDRASVGNLLVLANTLCFAAFLVLQRPVLARLPWRTVIAGSFVFGAAGVFLVGAPALLAVDPTAVPASTWAGIAYILVFPTVLAYALNTWAVRRSSPTLVAAYTTLQPITSALLAALFLGETFGWREAAGFALIAAGLWVVSRRQAARLAGGRDGR